MGNYYHHLLAAGLAGVGAVIIAHTILGPDLLRMIVTFILVVIGGLVPDLDHDRSVPLREVFNIVAAIVPFGIVIRMLEHGYSTEMVVVTFVIGYVLIRSGVSRVIMSVTHHRGMFHSIPMAVIFAECVMIFFRTSPLTVRIWFGLAGFIGVLTHLLVDALSSVDFANRMIGRWNISLFRSRDTIASVAAYTVMVLLAIVIIIPIPWPLELRI